MINGTPTDVPSLTEIEIQANKTEFSEMLLSTGRDGVRELLNYLETKTDFFAAPGSSRYHNNMGGGLCKHSLNVFYKLEKMYNLLAEELKMDVSHDTLVISALLHDVCKANYYTKKLCFRKNENDRWENYYGWTVEEQLPLGHGEKSVIIVNRFLTLTSLEMLTIRWHMGPWEAGVKEDPEKSKQYRAATENNFVKFFQLADIAAEMSEPKYEF